MRYSLGFFLLLCGLVLQSSAQPVLTPREEHCAFLGVLAHAITVDRNTGQPLTTTLLQLRQLLGSDVAAPLAMAIYQDLSYQVSPNQARQAAEVSCLTKGPDLVPVPQQPGHRS